MGTRRVARASVVALVVVTMAVVAFPEVGGSAPALSDHVPNLKTRKPTSLRISWSSGRKLLRFTNTIANVGAGALEVRPENDPAGTTTAFQHLYTHDASGAWWIASEHLVGTFVFHVEHAHWHFEDFAEYALHRVASGGGIGEVVSARQDKVSFCLADGLIVNRRKAHFSPTAVYPTTCSQDATQGISVGWADRYTWDLPGQYVDVSGVADGTYWLVSTVDPLGLLAETGDTNNRYALKVRISGDRVSVV